MGSRDAKMGLGASVDIPSIYIPREYERASVTFNSITARGVLRSRSPPRLRDCISTRTRELIPENTQTRICVYGNFFL